jgi:hypothetical protein
MNIPSKRSNTPIVPGSHLKKRTPSHQSWRGSPEVETSRQGRGRRENLQTPGLPFVRTEALGTSLWTDLPTRDNALLDLESSLRRTCGAVETVTYVL